LEGFRPRAEEDFKERRQVVQAAAGATLAEHSRDVARMVQHRSRLAKVASEVAHGNEGDGHPFRVAHSALRVFAMPSGFQKVVTSAINGYNLFVHRDDSWHGFRLPRQDTQTDGHFIGRKLG
jgi:hypothetical protein